MIEIDPRNGKILQQIDLNKADNQYRMATQYPPRTIFLGRNGKNSLHRHIKLLACVPVLSLSFFFSLFFFYEYKRIQSSHLRQQ